MLKNAPLNETEERFRKLVMATSDVVYRMSPDWQTMLQLRGGGLVSDTWEPMKDWMLLYIHPNDLELVKAAIAEAIAIKQMFQLEHRVVLADGRTGWLFSQAVPIFDDKGVVLEWFGTANDVSRRRAAEENLQLAKDEAEQQKRVYETITSSTPDLVYVFDLDYRFTYANKALLDMWGKTWDEGVGKLLLENGYEPWHAEMHEREIDLVVSTKSSIRGEVSFPHATLGRRIYDYIFTPVINADGVVVAVAGTTRDITDIRKAETSVKESENRFRTMAEEANILISLSDEKGQAVYFNKAWSVLTGKTVDELLKGGWIDVIHPADISGYLDVYAKAVKEQSTIHYNYRVRTVDGDYKWLLTDSATRQYNDGGFAGYITAAIDITILKLEDERKNDFISMVSHELKTPLTSALGYVQLSKMKAKHLDRQLVSLLERTEKQVQKMTTMIDGFLNVSRLESGRIDIQLKQFDIADLLHEIEQEALETYTSHQFDFGSTPSIQLLADYDKIGQVIQNFLSNAVKYTPVGSSIRVSVSHDVTKVRLTVGDNGPGISADDLSRLFERFYRAKDRQNSNISGFGIGLYLCSEIIKRHGGKIWAESTVGAGSNFSFTLPI